MMFIFGLIYLASMVFVAEDLRREKLGAPTWKHATLMIAFAPFVIVACVAYGLYLILFLIDAEEDEHD